jgi:branched-chain amino acid transport system ATP-binding protein
MLEARDITVRFGGFVAVKSVSIEVSPGEIVGIIGPNGAGKSTLFSAFAGLVPTAQGLFKIDGRTIKPAPHTLACSGVLRTFQVPREFARLSVIDNLCVASRRHPGDRLVQALIMCERTRSYERSLREKAQQMLEWMKLDPVANNPAGSLSGGQKKLLELARALMLEPRYLLLDEPYAGVSGPVADTISERLCDLTKSSVGILIIEHNMEQMVRLCRRIVAMADGKVIATGSPSEIIEDATVVDAYIGRRA